MIGECVCLCVSVCVFSECVCVLTHLSPCRSYSTSDYDSRQCRSSPDLLTDVSKQVSILHVYYSSSFLQHSWSIGAVYTKLDFYIVNQLYLKCLLTFLLKLQSLIFTVFSSTLNIFVYSNLFYLYIHSLTTLHKCS